MSASDPPISELMKRVRRDRDAESKLAEYFGSQCIAAATHLMSAKLKTFIEPEAIANEAMRSAISDLTHCRFSPGNREEFFRLLWLKARNKVVDAARIMDAERRDFARNSSLDHTHVFDLSTLSPEVQASIDEQAAKIASAVVGKYIVDPVRPARLMTATLAAFTGMTPNEIHERVVAATGIDVAPSTVAHTVGEVRHKIEEWLKRPDDDAAQAS